MSGNLITSTVYGCWDALHDLLQDADFGAHPANPGGTVVHFGFPEDNVELGQENVVLIGGISGYKQESWTFGEGRREETYDLLVFCSVAVPGTPHAEVRERLKQMSDAIETAVRTSRAGSSRTSRPDVDGVDWWEVTNIAPLVTGDANGHIGRVELTVSVTSHI